MNSTRLTRFSDDFKNALGPLRTELEAASTLLSEAAQGVPGRSQAKGLAATVEEMDRLFERVDSERASVLVFGPPNAGKSTLLNALARRPMVNVSRLPGYPTPVRVRFGERPRVVLTRFDGTTTEAQSGQAVRVMLQRAQGELSRRVREVRAGGEDFEPASHMRSAFRRVDFDLNLGELETSRVELVECPPRGSHLAPTYGEMLMGQLDGPAVAVFVVRTEELFDEAVFAGFEELLDLFGSFFLVVNLDGQSRDLTPEGEVIPSQEGRDPVRLFELIESFCTSQRVLDALEEERIRVVPSDLLEAARRRVVGETGPDGAEVPAADAPADPEEPAFAEFLSELTEALDAHEGVTTLAQSALRRAQELSEETRSWVEAPAFAEVAQDLLAAESQLERERGVESALARLAERQPTDWGAEAPFVTLAEGTTERVVAHARQLAAEGRGVLSGLLDDWFQTGESVEELLAQRLQPRLDAAGRDLLIFAGRTLREALEAGLPAFTGEVAEDLALVGLDPASFLEAPRESGVRPEGVRLRPLDVEAIPVRTRFLDSMLLRSSNAVRRRLFGPLDAPKRLLSADEKQRLLGDEAREQMKASAAERMETHLEELGRLLTQELLRRALASFHGALGTKLAERRHGLGDALEELAARRAELARVHRGVEALSLARSAAAESLRALAEPFAAEREVLVPTPPPVAEESESDTILPPLTGPASPRLEAALGPGAQVTAQEEEELGAGPFS